MHPWLPQRQLRWRVLWLVIGWALVGTVVWFSLTPRLPPFGLSFEVMDKVVHFIAYFTLMIWFAFLYLRTAHIWIAAALLALGVALEGAQHVSGYRLFEVADIVADAAGVLAGFLLARTPFARLLQFVERRAA